MSLHPTQTAEYWERNARNERAFAKERQQTVESKQVHLHNAEQYERKASALRMDERVEQIRRANASWQPRPAENPAGFHAKNDIEFLLAVIDELRGQSI